METTQTEVLPWIRKGWELTYKSVGTGLLEPGHAEWEAKRKTTDIASTIFCGLGYGCLAGGLFWLPTFTACLSAVAIGHVLRDMGEEIYRHGLQIFKPVPPPPPLDTALIRSRTNEIIAVFPDCADSFSIDRWLDEPWEQVKRELATLYSDHCQEVILSKILANKWTWMEVYDHYPELFQENPPFKMDSWEGLIPLRGQSHASASINAVLGHRQRAFEQYGPKGLLEAIEVIRHEELQGIDYPKMIQLFSWRWLAALTGKHHERVLQQFWMAVLENGQYDPAWMIHQCKALHYLSIDPAEAHARYITYWQQRIDAEITGRQWTVNEVIAAYPGLFKPSLAGVMLDNVIKRISFPELADKAVTYREVLRRYGNTVAQFPSVAVQKGLDEKRELERKHLEKVIPDLLALPVLPMAEMVAEFSQSALTAALEIRQHLPDEYQRPRTAEQPEQIDVAACDGELETALQIDIVLRSQFQELGLWEEQYGQLQRQHSGRDYQFHYMAKLLAGQGKLWKQVIYWRDPYFFQNEIMGMGRTMKELLEERWVDYGLKQVIDNERELFLRAMERGDIPESFILTV